MIDRKKKKTSEFLQEWRKRATILFLIFLLRNADFSPKNAVFFSKNIVCLPKYARLHICNIFIHKYLMIKTGPISELRNYLWHFSSWVINVSLDNVTYFYSTFDGLWLILYIPTESDFNENAWILLLIDNLHIFRNHDP